MIQVATISLLLMAATGCVVQETPSASGGKFEMEHKYAGHVTQMLAPIKDKLEMLAALLTHPNLGLGAILRRKAEWWAHVALLKRAAPTDGATSDQERG